MHWMFSNKKGILKLFFGFLISIAGNSVVIIQRTPNDINSMLTHKKTRPLRIQVQTGDGENCQEKEKCW